jgi:hypothetical protein
MSFKEFLDDINVMEGMTLGQKSLLCVYFIGFWMFFIYATLNEDTLKNRIMEYEDILQQQEQVIEEYERLYGTLPIATE